MININITITGAAETADTTAATASLQWQPIESSPRTSNARLVWCPDRQNTYLVAWSEINHGWYHFSPPSARLQETPTLWMWPPSGPVSP